MLRSRLNCRVIGSSPSVLDEVIESMPAMVENWRLERRGHRRRHGLRDSRRAAAAVTWMVGKSTLGRSLTGKRAIAAMPKIRMPT